jgi:hypothetical protein
MWLLTLLWLLLCTFVWRVTGLDAAGRVLVAALGSQNENVSTTAGMLLVKAGKKSEPLLLDALRQRENLPLVITILTDLGSRQFEPEIRRLSHDQDPQVARAAEDALRLLAARP